MHMPGPWTIEGQFDAEVSVEILSADGRRVCEIEPFTEEWTVEEIANVHLLAAASDLLKACTAIAAFLRTYGAVFTPSDSYKQVIAAIAKAEGR